MQPLYAVIGSGQNVSAEVDLRKRSLTGIIVPALDSADLAIQGNIDTTSANFVRLLDARGQAGSGDLRFPVATGSRMIHFTSAGMLETIPYVRIETVMATGSAQTNPRTLTLLTKPRR